MLGRWGPLSGKTVPGEEPTSREFVHLRGDFAHAARLRQANMTLLTLRHEPLFATVKSGLGKD
ncbi:hypothetical protein [Bradyrhizobium sp. ORS 375]|uniref:hypothetical protein n=1 Tax=Bradyrhizobium sp. (strain ORS 375) TaxID=566679 RepID=UPI001111B9B3|nr:hypothetical protein [Bradyrhizobium sp. ORS 375]